MDDRRVEDAPQVEAATQPASSVGSSSAEAASLPLSEARNAQGLAADVRGFAEKPVADKSHLRKMWKWLTGTPSRKALSVLAAVLLAAISGIVGTVAGGVLGDDSNGTVDATQVVVYTPWAPDGQPSTGIGIAANLSGFCFSGSGVTARPDALRVNLSMIHASQTRVIPMQLASLLPLLRSE